MEERKIFVVVPASTYEVVPDTLVYCNLYKGDTDKYELKYVLDNTDLKGVDTVLKPMEGVVISRENLANLICDIYRKLRQTDRDIDSFVFDYIFHRQEQPFVENINYDNLLPVGALSQETLNEAYPERLEGVTIKHLGSKLIYWNDKWRKLPQ
jgi:hypothetical protein